MTIKKAWCVHYTASDGVFVDATRLKHACQDWLAHRGNMEVAVHYTPPCEANWSAFQGLCGHHVVADLQVHSGECLLYY